MLAMDKLFAGGFADRLAIWRAAWWMFLQAPVMGVGWGQFAWHDFEFRALFGTQFLRPAQHARIPAIVCFFSGRGGNRTGAWGNPGVCSGVAASCLPRCAVLLVLGFVNAALLWHNYGDFQRMFVQGAPFA